LYASLDDFLKAEGILEELQVQAVKEVVPGSSKRR